MSTADDAVGMVRWLWRTATYPETAVAFAVLAFAWLAGFTGVLPKEVWVIDFPALVVAFFLDTLAFNEFGVRENTVFYPALVLFGYLEAIVVGAVIRWIRRPESGRIGGEDDE